FLSDGLSEATFLLFAALALWLGVRALRTRSGMQFALAGLCGGLAYLTRPEGGLVVAALGLVLATSQFVRAFRLPRRRFLICAACLVLGALVFVGPYVAVIGHITNKHSIQNVITNQRVQGGSSGVQSFPLAVWHS